MVGCANVLLAAAAMSGDVAHFCERKIATDASLQRWGKSNTGLESNDLSYWNGRPLHDSIAFNCANPLAISPSNFSISAMIAGGGA